MQKYWHVINIGIQNTLVYRFNFVVRAVFGLIPLAATIFLWRAVFAGNHTENHDASTVASYTLGEMISYYLIVTIVDALTAVTDDDWQMAADIRDGAISQFLLKPIDYLYYRFCLFFSGRMIYSSVALVPVGLFVLYYHGYFVLPADAATFGWFALSVMLTAMLQFLISFTMAMLAFWVMEVSTFIFILFAIEYLASGHLFPLDVLPPAVSKALYLTPFPYQMFFPVSIYLGKTTGASLWQGMLVQAFWVAALYGVARFVWSRGIRRYGAYGG